MATVLVALFAIVGLVLSFKDWHDSFASNKRKLSLYIGLFVSVSTMLAVILVILKYYFKSIWDDYRNPATFYNQLMLEQTKANQQSKVRAVIGSYQMWGEIAILLMDPYLFNDQITYTMQTTSFIKASLYETRYRVTDVVLSLMLLRFYFLVQAALVLSPIEKLSARRICFLRGFEIDFWF